MTIENTPSDTRYVAFQDEDDDIQAPTGNRQPSPVSDFELMVNGTAGGQSQRKRVRLRAVETEREYFLNLMNVDLFRKLVSVQSGASIVIVLCQIVLYAIVTRQTYKVVDYVGIGLWGPLLFFSIACWLTWFTTRAPSGCLVGTAMAFQILSFVVGILLLIFATIALVQHGEYSYWRSGSHEYDPEVTGRIFCSLMILCAAHEAVVFDIETMKA
ncbi:hypothetical protein Ocin01_04747 [Orchesella cincta]|uniref:Uncharacterized protein n=1 Tax=Orchesella cincta TaxID=48709 RepID=A0A1D2NAF0_ORCCI|nr:hypothetical protein Ocin01_04747 [Orchesella cincta]